MFAITTMIIIETQTLKVKVENIIRIYVRAILLKTRGQRRPPSLNKSPAPHSLNLFVHGPPAP